MKGTNKVEGCAPADCVSGVGEATWSCTKIRNCSSAGKGMSVNSICGCSEGSTGSKSCRVICVGVLVACCDNAGVGVGEPTWANATAEDDAWRAGFQQGLREVRAAVAERAKAPA